MTPRIKNILVANHRLDPHETELRVHIEIEHLTPQTEIRGRLVGPRLAHTSTIEIAYPLRALERSANHVVLRVVIPEANWWDPETPFLYEGPVELWHDGKLCDRREISHGIRSH